MSFRLRILNRIARYQMKFRAAWHRWWFLFGEKPRHKSIELGEGVTFFAPVRGGGQGTIRIGKETKLGFLPAFRFGSGEIMLQARSPEAEIVIGENCWFSNNVELTAARSIKIGNHCLIGQAVSILDADFHEINPATRMRSEGIVGPVNIGNNVWVGSRTMVLKGVSIGDNSVIGAMSLVTKDIPANCVAAGNPARVVRKLE
jgi:maltose O-acetyltransferase